MLALIIVLSLLGLFVISHFIVIYLIFKKFFARMSLERIDELYDKNPLYDENRKEIYAGKEFLLKEKYQEVSITSYDGYKLVGYFYNYGNSKCVVMFHGAHSDPFLIFGVQAKRFVKDGYNLLIVNQRAHHQSEGKYLTYGKDESKDVLDWVRYLKEELEQKELILYGISMGATALMLASPNLDSSYVKGLVVDSGYTSIDALVNHLVSSQKIPSFLFLGGVKVLAKKLAKVSFDQFDTTVSIENCKIPAFFVGGKLDKVATEDFLMNNYNKCFSKKDYLLIEGAGHTLAMVIGGEEAYNRVMKFINNNKGE